jgi:tetrachlorobenzoquinone reductase
MISAMEHGSRGHGHCVIPALLSAIHSEAKDVVSLHLVPVSQIPFPSFEPGAHIDLWLGNGLVRSYSLVNAPDDSNRYVVAVLRESGSRGGSRFVHENLRVGDVINISAPRNTFPLIDDDGASVLLAGGIGITPIYCMMCHLVRSARSVQLIYCSRARDHAAFSDAINSLATKHDNLKVVWHFDSEEGGPPSLVHLLQSHGPEAHYYCCGPTAMIDAFSAACVSLNYRKTHIERFSRSAALIPNPKDSAFVVELARTGISLSVGADESILDAMINAGLSPGFSCKEGICGTCETAVLSGEIEHRDEILSEDERRSGHTMMVCVSRCKGKGPLVLDI